MEKKEKKQKKKNKSLILLVVIILVIIVALVLYFFVDKAEEVTTTESEDNSEVVSELYNIIQADECNVIETDNENNSALYLVFSSLKNDDLLSDSISLEDYKTAFSNIFGTENYVYPSNYSYGGYSYTSNGDTITRAESQCGDKEYVSKLYGYSYNDDSLVLNVKVGYILSDKVYDLSDNELGDYDENTITKILDGGSNQKYTFVKSGSNYYLDSIE